MLAQLQKELTDSSQTPEGLDRLLELLAQPPAASPQEKEYGQVLSLIIDDTLNGVDISRRYPDFFKQMVTDLALREAFLDTLEILELSRAEKLEPLPGEPSHDLSFLHKQPAQPNIELAESGQWRVSYHQTTSQIDSIFAVYWGRSTRTPFREGHNYFDHDPIILIRDEVMIENKKYGIVLEAVHWMDTPEQINLLLLITTTRGTTTAFQADVKWGSFEEIITLNKFGQGQFRPIPLSAVLDAAGQAVAAELYLEVSSTAALKI